MHFMAGALLPHEIYNYMLGGSFMKAAKKWSKMLQVGIFSMVLIFGSAGGVFAASDLFNLKSGPTTQQSTVFVDVGTTLSYLMNDGIGAGVGFERAFGESWTGLIHAAIGFYSYDYGSDEASALAFEVDVHGRYYIFKTALDKLFVDLGLGYEYYGYKYEYDLWGKHYDYGYNVSSLTITPKAGWKFIFGKGWVVEPSLGYTIGIGIGKTGAHKSGGFNVGLGLGWAF
jgi:hypothetical protein